MDPSQPIAEGIALYGNRIASVGGKKEILGLKTRKTEVIDCRGKTILPGFIDAHVHLTALAESLIILSLEPSAGVQSIADIQAKVLEASHQVPPGTWIRAAAYNEFYLREKRHPTRWDLDQAAPLHPVKLTHRSGHAHVLNSLALRLAGISPNTPDPPGGRIERDLGTSEPTGILYNMGASLSKILPALEESQMEEGIKAANLRLISSGITSVQDASARNDLRRWKRFQDWKERGILTPRVTMMIGAEECGENWDAIRGESQENTSLRGGAVKIVLGETSGRLEPVQDELYSMLGEIQNRGRQAVLHAVEEAEIAAACSAIEYAVLRFPRGDHRHRIEHCAVCPPPLASRVASLGVRVVTQPSFIHSNGDRYLQTVPAPDLQNLYPLATLMRMGVQVAAGSDAPIGILSPCLGIYSAVSRRTASGGTVLPEEGITPQQALNMYTEKAAQAAFEENLKGSIIPGKLADLVVLNADPTRVPGEELKHLEVEMTIIDGRIAWSRR